MNTADKNSKLIELSIMAPDGGFEPIICDSVRLTIGDGKKGHESGFYGVRYGHARMVMLLEAGTITGALNGKTVVTATTGRGFARIDRASVCVTVDELMEIKYE